MGKHLSNSHRERHHRNPQSPSKCDWHRIRVGLAAWVSLGDSVVKPNAFQKDLTFAPVAHLTALKVARDRRRLFDKDIKRSFPAVVARLDYFGPRQRCMILPMRMPCAAILQPASNASSTMYSKPTPLHLAMSVRSYDDNISTLSTQHQSGRCASCFPKKHW